MKVITLLSLILLSMFSVNLAAQTCNESVQETTPNSRFTINGDGTITDRKTRLMWAQCRQGFSGLNCSAGKEELFTWSAALALTMATSDTQNRTDWRLPNIKELQTLVEVSCVSPSINDNVFPNTSIPRLASIYWSSSPNASSFLTGTWVVQFSHGSITTASRSSSQSVRLVRGGQ